MPGILSAFHIAKTGLQFQEMNLSVKAHNLAAQGADAYKEESLMGLTLGYIDAENVGSITSETGTISPAGTQIGLGIDPAGVYRNFTQGDPLNTGQELDVMIDGDGFFLVSLPDGTTGYTRVGSLQKNANNQIVMPKTGYVISPGITLPQNALKILINRDGQIYANLPGQTAPQLVGQLQMATFLNPSGLRAIEDSIFLESESSGTPDEGVAGTNRRGTIKQYWKEGSNVNPVKEMTDLIKIEKIYDMLTKVIKSGDEMLSAQVQIKTWGIYAF